MSSANFNPGALNEFKSRINYPKIQNGLPKDGKQVLLDWDNYLERIVVDSEAWLAEDRSVSILEPYHAEINAMFDNGDSEIDIDVHLYSKHSNIDVLEEALLILSRTSMVEINIAYDEGGPCDVYFHKHSTLGGDYGRGICVFRNVIIEANVSGVGIDLQSVMAAFRRDMEASLVDKNEIKVVDAPYDLSSHEVSIGQEFEVTIGLPVKSSYRLKLHQDFEGNLELLDVLGNTFKFRAINRGTHNITISILDPKTLVSSAISAVVSVSHN